MAALRTLLLLALASAAAVAAPQHDADLEDDGCLPCKKEGCPKNPRDCPFGLASPDPCGCCNYGVCGLPFMTKCYNASLPLPASHKRYGICGENSVCLLRDDVHNWLQPEALCMCKHEGLVCGTNNRTYESICHLELEGVHDWRATGSYVAPTVDVHFKGPCPSGPWVVTKPLARYVQEYHSYATLCEVKGYPTPSVSWEFWSTNGTYSVLPGDDMNLGLQIRGGPGPYMVSSWLQIMKMHPHHAGNYTCVGKNRWGTVRSTVPIYLL